MHRRCVVVCVAVAVPRPDVLLGSVVAFGVVFALMQGREIADTARAVRTLAATPRDSVPTPATDTG